MAAQFIRDHGPLGLLLRKTLTGIAIAHVPLVVRSGAVPTDALSEVLAKAVDPKSHRQTTWQFQLSAGNCCPLIKHPRDITLQFLPGQKLEKTEIIPHRSNRLKWFQYLVLGVRPPIFTIAKPTDSVGWIYGRFIWLKSLKTLPKIMR